MKHLAAALLLVATAAAASGDPVTFPGPGVTLAGRLYRPAGDGPFPAIVLMHGCSGMWRGDGQEPTVSYAAWAEHWRSKGFIALLVDSFGPRGQKEICTQRNRPISPARDRPKDAYASLAWLVARKDVDPAHVHLQGWSNGAMAVLSTVQEDAPGRPAKGPEFRSAVAFYPGCVNLLKKPYRATVPLLIQSGAADDWTPAVHCEALVEQARGHGLPIEIDVYPEAHHAFDGVGAVRTRSDVSNAASPTGWGATVGANPAAREKAYARTTAWVLAKDR